MILHALLLVLEWNRFRRDGRSQPMTFSADRMIRDVQTDIKSRLSEPAFKWDINGMNIVSPSFAQIYISLGGTVPQAVAPTTFGLDAHGGRGFESGPMSFLLSTPHLFSLSFPVPLFTAPSIKGTKAQK